MYFKETKKNLTIRIVATISIGHTCSWSRESPFEINLASQVEIDSTTLKTNAENLPDFDATSKAFRNAAHNLDISSKHDLLMADYLLEGSKRVKPSIIKKIEQLATQKAGHTIFSTKEEHTIKEAINIHNAYTEEQMHQFPFKFFFERIIGVPDKLPQRVPYSTKMMRKEADAVSDLSALIKLNATQTRAVRKKAQGHFNNLSLIYQEIGNHKQSAKSSFERLASQADELLGRVDILHGQP